MESLTFEEQSNNEREYGKRDYFLYHFELHQGERTAVAYESYAVCRHLCTVFKECKRPGEEYYSYERPAVRYFHFLELEVPIPGEGHKYVRSYKQQDSADDFSHKYVLILRPQI